MDVNQVPFETGRFYVESRSRTDITHLVDLAWREEPWRKPHPQCSCESSFCHGRICPHIIAAVNHELARLEL
jgi:hypothetical protein